MSPPQHPSALSSSARKEPRAGVVSGPQKSLCLVVLQDCQLPGKRCSFPPHSSAARKQTGQQTCCIRQGAGKGGPGVGWGIGRVLPQSRPRNVPRPKGIKMDTHKSVSGRGRTTQTPAGPRLWLFFVSRPKDQRQGYSAAHREDTQRTGTTTETKLGLTLKTADCSAFDSFLKKDWAEKRQMR